MKDEYILKEIILVQSSFKYSIFILVVYYLY